MVAGEGLGRSTDLFAYSVQVILGVTQLSCVTTAWGMYKGDTTINLFLLCMAGSAKHDSVSDLPAAIPIDQVLARRHKSTLQKYALLE